MQIKQLSWLLSVSLLPASCAYAAAGETAEATKDKDVMTVWSSPVAATNDVVNQETINRLNRRNVAEALNIVPGVMLQKSGGRSEQQVKVRGFDSRQVPVFLDGVPIYVPYDGNLDLGRFQASDLAAVEVSKGYTSLLQGPNQMGGSINLTTLRPKKELEANVRVNQGWSRGRDNAHNMDASFGGKSELGFFQISGSRQKQRFTGLPHGVDNPTAGSEGQRMNSANDDKRGMLKVGFTPRESDEYTFTYINQEGEKNTPPYAGNSSQSARYWQWPDYNKKSYYYQGTTKLSDRMTLKSRFYHDEFENTLLMYKTLADFKSKVGNYSHYADFSNGAGLQLGIDMRELDQLSFAIHWKDDVHREKGALDAPYDRYKDRTWSMASEYQWNLSDKLDAVFGVSYDWRDSKQGMKHEKNGSLTNYDQNNQDAFNWQMMTKYRFDNRDELQLSLSERSRFPTLKERYTTSKPAKNQTALVNPNLKPERAQNLELNYRGGLTEGWGYDASVYYNRVSDAILAHNITPSLIQNRNSGRVDYYGMDLGIHGDVKDWLTVGVNYGLIHSDAKRKDIGNIVDLPKHKVFAWATITPVEPVSITVMEEARSWGFNNSDNNDKTRGFAMTNVRVDYRLGAGFSVNASVNNLFDTAYAYQEGYVEEGRNYWLGVAYQY
ncbi:TonB-dependent receptor plug domain-containing protein [Pectobacterium parmentieri]|uniref:TonB-dependent receptor plug domain-containing protein n=1 Tax=Pectobacterium parmentieri TaxID=1905730 RepID=UPI001E61731E|nr:TonB-dependent receptor [Pectobacterium parmentieri]